MTVSELTTEVHYDPDCNPDHLEQVLRALDQWSSRTARHVTHQRRSDRHDFRSVVYIEPRAGVPGALPIRQIFHVTTRNVSKTGLGFVAPPVFMPRLLSDDTPLVRSEVIFREGAHVKIRLQAGDREMPTLSAEISRLRLVHFGFFDIGVRFLARENQE